MDDQYEGMFFFIKPSSQVSLVPIGSMYGIYANIWDILMVNVTIYGLHTDPMGNIYHQHSKTMFVWNYSMYYKAN